MRKQLLRLGILSLFVLLACAAKAQNVVATWDFQNRIPASLADVTIQGSTGEVASDVEGVSLFVDATNGKFSVRDGDVQINDGTIIRVPVKSAKDIVAITPYSGYGNFTINGEAGDTQNVTEHKATTAEAANGYVEILGGSNCYLYKITVTFVSAVQSKELYSTDFSDWEVLEATAEEKVAETSNTKYSRETISFKVYNTDVAPDPNTINIDWSKFDEDKVGGTLRSEKNGKGYIETSALKSITKVSFVHGATGSNRGWKLFAKGDGDVDWGEPIVNTVANPKEWCEVNVDVNKSNCQLRFESIDDTQNAYMFQLRIYGNVDISQYPALGTFTYNNETYNAADIFTETSETCRKQLSSYSTT